jgi:deoxyhypusine monooxygenase
MEVAQQPQVEEKNYSKDMMTLEECKRVFLAPTKDVCEKYTAMMTLRTFGSQEAADILEQGYRFLGESELLRHDVMYCMGQMRARNSLKFLLDRMNDQNERSIVRHEAGEALANFHDIKEQIIAEMQNHWDTPDELLRSTVHVGIGKLKNYHDKARYGQKYGGTIEPAEPFNDAETREYIKSLGIEVPESQAELLNTVETVLLKPYSEINEFYKYRLCYFLRDLADKRSKEILCKILSAPSRPVISPLLRHELCFIMGQINYKDKIIQDTLKAVSIDQDEHPVVRHEAILSFYDVTQDEEFIKEFFSHENQLIRESVEVAYKIGE